MLDYLKRNGQFVVMLLIWLAAGMVNSMLAVGVVCLSVLLLKYKNLYGEMLAGFILILVLSDSYKEYFQFAKDVKGIYLLLLAVFFLFDRKEFKLKDSFVLPFIPFFIWAGFQIFRSPELPVAIQKTLSYFLLFLAAPPYIMKLFYEKGTVFIRDHVFLMTLILMSGIFLYLFAQDKVLLGDRYTGVMGNPNAIGLFCLMFFMLFYSSTVKFPTLFTRNEQILIYSFIAISVLLSGSRNTILSVALFLFFMRFYKISPIIGTVIVIATVIVFQLIMSNLTDILSTLGLAKALRADTIESGSGRLVAWGFAWNYINSSAKAFIFGSGFGFDDIIFGWNKEMLINLGHVGGVHNSFLALWLNTGIVGLVLWMFAFLRTIIKVFSHSYMVLPFFYAVLFSASFEPWLMGSLNPYTITFLFTLSLMYVKPELFADNKPEPSQTESEPPPLIK